MVMVSKSLYDALTDPIGENEIRMIPMAASIRSEVVIQSLQFF